MEAASCSPILPIFSLTSDGLLSQLFLQRGLSRFDAAALYVRSLQYCRTSDPRDYRLVLLEGRGTCSSKHGLLAALAEEQEQPLGLLLGIFNWKPTGRGQELLRRNGLDSIPECHAYLGWQGQRLDFTGELFPIDMRLQILAERPAAAVSLVDEKTAFHKEFLRCWLTQKQLTLSFEELWLIREECLGIVCGR